MIFFTRCSAFGAEVRLLCNCTVITYGPVGFYDQFFATTVAGAWGGDWVVFAVLELPVNGLVAMRAELVENR
jgi:hypothetical protein